MAPIASANDNQLFDLSDPATAATMAQYLLELTDAVGSGTSSPPAAPEPEATPAFAYPGFLQDIDRLLREDWDDLTADVASTCDTSVATPLLPFSLEKTYAELRHLSWSSLSGGSDTPIWASTSYGGSSSPRSLPAKRAPTEAAPCLTPLPPPALAETWGGNLTPSSSSENDQRSFQQQQQELLCFGGGNEDATLPNSNLPPHISWETQGTAVKLFVNRIPKWMTNDQLRSVFAPYGEIKECNILRDTHGPRGCAFVKYASIADAYQAILHLHGKRILNEESGPVQIKYADGEIDRLGLSAEVQPGGESVKVFVGSLPKSCTQETLLDLFSRFGRVDEVFLLRDQTGQSKRSAFITFPKMSMALEAIQAFDRTCALPNSRRPLEVRLAESKASKGRNSRKESGSHTPPKSNDRSATTARRSTNNRKLPPKGACADQQDGCPHQHHETLLP